MQLSQKIKTPFAKDGSRYFLPWIVMIMVFLGVLCMSLGLSLDKLLSKWENSIVGSITVQVLPSAEESANGKLFAENVAALLNAIKQTPGVKSARTLEQEELNRLLKPWFSSDELINELPIPRVIDVVLDENFTLDIDVLQSLLKYYTTNATVDIHRTWLNRLSALISSLKMLAYGVLCLIIGSTIVLVIYATTTTVSLHRPVIDLLHLIGATDGYVARQISLKVFDFSIRGALYGFIMAVPIVLGIGYYIRSFDQNLSAIISLNFDNWMFLAWCSLCVAMISTVSAYITVMKKLRQRL